METLTMSRKERDRLTVMAGVTRQELRLVQAAAVMGLGYRQSKRVWRRYQAEGDAGLVHRLRGKPRSRSCIYRLKFEMGGAVVAIAFDEHICHFPLKI
jgi:hypothetical protein